MKRNGFVLRLVSFVVAVVFMWTNCVWAGGVVLPQDKLAAMHQTPLVDPKLGRLLRDARVLEQWGIKDLRDVVEKMSELQKKGIICFVRTDSTGKEAKYIFGEGVILRVAEEGVNDDFYQLLGIKGIRDGEYEWIKIPQEKIPLINSFLGGINPDWQIKEPEKIGEGSGQKNPHLLPKYLYDAFRAELIKQGIVDENNVDSFIVQISWTDENGVVHIAEGPINEKAVEIMAEVLTRILQENENERAKRENREPRVIKKTKEDILSVLQLHEQVHRFIKEYNIDIARILEQLRAYFDNDETRLGEFFTSFAKNYNYPRADLLRLTEELIAHTIVERKVFNQPVRILDTNGNRKDLDPGIERVIIRGIVEQVVIRFSFSNDIDRNYLIALYMKFLAPVVSALKIKGNFYPSAMLSKEEREDVLGAVEYTTLAKDPHNAEEAKNVRLTLNPMDGGIGSSVVRDRYLMKLGMARTDENGNIILSSKSADLYFEVQVNGKEHLISIMEAKLLKAILEAKKGKGKYKSISYQLLGSPETMESFNRLLDSPCILDPSRTYRKYIEDETDLEIADVLLQGKIPTLEKGKLGLTNERTAPGGHGQWGVMILLEALGFQLPTDGSKVIRAFYNGDGPNNGVDPVITGWMAREGVPIIMISTTATGIDKKGGKIGVEYLGPSRTKPRKQMMELAQAKSAGQEQLFYRIGLPEGVEDGAESGAQYFNTNTALLNYSVLTPLLNDLVGVIGRDRFVEIIAPDLIQNEKEQGGKKFIQLEGALGSVLLNLDAYIQTVEDPEVVEVLKKHGIIKPNGRRVFLRIVNVDVGNRTRFFTPQKNAFDYWFQFHSGRFRFDPDKMELVDNYPEKPLPNINLSDKYYDDVQNLIEGFEKMDIIDLETLNINGKVVLKGVKLIGTVTIINGTEEVVDLDKMDGKAVVIDLNNPSNRRVFNKRDFIQNGKVVLKDCLIVYGASEIHIWDYILKYMVAYAGKRLDAYIEELEQSPDNRVWSYILKKARENPGKSALELYDMYFMENREEFQKKLDEQGANIGELIKGKCKELVDLSLNLKNKGLEGTRYLPVMYNPRADHTFDRKIIEEGKGAFRLIGSRSRDSRPGAATTRISEPYSHRIYGREKDEQANPEKNEPPKVMARYRRVFFGKDISAWIITNPFPIFDMHIQLIWPENVRQRMTIEFLRIAIEFAKETGFSGFFNSIGANASQNHPHIQFFQETDNNMGLDVVDIKWLYTVKSIKIGRMANDSKFPVSGFVFEPQDKNSITLDRLAMIVQAVLEDIMVKNIPFNIVFRNGRVYVFPRKILPAGKFGQSFAGAELIGHLLLTGKELLYTPWIQDHPEVMNIEKYNQIQDRLKKGDEDAKKELEEYIAKAKDHISHQDVRDAYKRVCLNPDSVEFKTLERDLGLMANVMEGGQTLLDLIDTTVGEDIFLRLILISLVAGPESKLYSSIKFLLDREHMQYAVRQLTLDIFKLEDQIRQLRMEIGITSDENDKKKLMGQLGGLEKQKGQWEELIKMTKEEYKFSATLTELLPDEINGLIKSSPLSKTIDTNKEEVVYSRIKVDISGNVLGVEELVKDSRVDVEAIRGLLSYLVKEYGSLGPIREVVIVDNLGGIDSEIPEVQRGGVAYIVGDRMVVDIDVFRNPTALKDVGTHENFEAVLRLVEQNPAVQEVTSIYCSLEKLLELKPEELNSYIEFLKQSDNGLDSTEYARLLELARGKKGEDLIALSIGYVLNTPRYRHLEVSLNDVLKAKEKLELARNIYKDIVSAKKGVGELTKEVQPVVSAVRLAKAKAKVQMITSLWRVNPGFIDALIQNNKYIMLDREDLQKPENQYMREWIEKVSKGKEKNPFIYSDQPLPEGVSPEDVIYLVEPERVDKGKMPNVGLYLPLPYSITSIYLASQVVLAGGDVKGMDKLALNTIRAIYETLLGRDVVDKELEELFRKPWEVLPPIVQISATLNTLRKAIVEIEKAA